MRWQDIPAEALAAFRAGTVIPAHPLALDADRRLDERRQRALTRYYLDAGAGGLAVGVHTTQFAIRDVGLYRPVLELAVETARAWTPRPLFLVAGVAGRTRAGRRRGAGRARARLPRGAREPRGVPRRRRGGDARALPRPRRRAARGRLLPAARGRRRPPLALVLGALRRDRERRRHQGRAVRPLPHARRRPRRRGGGRAGAHLALHRQRRPHRARPDGAVPHARRASCASSAACSATGRSGRARPSRSSSAAAPCAASTPCPPTCWRSTAPSRTATPRSSTSRTRSTA